MGGCKSAIDDFRRTYGISEKVHFPLPHSGAYKLPHTGAYWKKERNVQISAADYSKTFPHDQQSSARMKV